MTVGVIETVGWSRDLAVVIGKVAFDDRELEGSKDRLLRFAIQQKAKAIPHQVLDRASARPALEVGCRDEYLVLTARGALGDLDPTAMAASILQATHRQGHRL